MLRGSMQLGWSEAAQLMWEIASPLNETSQVAQYLLANGWSIEPHAKLFVQANHSDVLAEFVRIAGKFVRIVGSYFDAQGDAILPRGR